MHWKPVRTFSGKRPVWQKPSMRGPEESISAASASKPRHVINPQNPKPCQPRVKAMSMVQLHDAVTQLDQDLLRPWMKTLRAFDVFDDSCLIKSVAMSTTGCVTNQCFKGSKGAPVPHDSTLDANARPGLVGHRPFWRNLVNVYPCMRHKTLPKPLNFSPTRLLTNTP